MSNITHFYRSPVGWLKLTFSSSALLSIHFCEKSPDERTRKSSKIVDETIQELSEYFKDKRKTFSIPLNPKGTNFQKSVWDILQKIPYGQTTTYGALAKKLGNPDKVRAVANANGQNPIPIIIPCHRVIGSNNNLVGYSGGIERKQYLLKHEGALLL